MDVACFLKHPCAYQLLPAIFLVLGMHKHDDSTMPIKMVVKLCYSAVIAHILLERDRFWTAKIALMAGFSGQRLSQARRSQPRKVTQKTLGDKVGTSRGMIARYEQGLDTPSESMQLKLANALNVPLEFFDETVKKGQEISPNAVTITGTPAQQDFQEIPYWGEVPAGDWTMPQGDDALPPMQVERSLAKSGRVSVRIAGDSMSPRLEHGDIVHIQLSKTPREGCITLARNGDKELTLKLLKHKEGQWELHSFNPSFPNPTAVQWEILGYAVVIERHFGPGRYTREVDEVGIRA